MKFAQLIRCEISFFRNHAGNETCCGVVVMNTAQLHLTKPEVRFCASSNTLCNVWDICSGEDL